MEFLLAIFGLVGGAMFAHGLYALFELRSENEIGLATMTATELGLGTLIMVGACGFGNVISLLRDDKDRHARIDSQNGAATVRHEADEAR